jgi:hypothetical protein
MILKSNLNKVSKRQGTRKKELLNFGIVFLVACTLCLASSLTSCNIYKFNEAGTLPPEIKTVKINYIENKAQYINPQLSQKLTDKLRQKVIGQTRLSQINSDNADWDISGFITGYSFSTSAISGQQVATNRLTVSVHIILNDRKAEENNRSADVKKEYDVSRSFEFKGSQSFQQAEASLSEEMVRTLTDEIFNKLFSNW